MFVPSTKSMFPITMRTQNRSPALLAFLVGVALLWLSGNALRAAEDDPADWRLECRLGERAFALSFDSESDDVFADDMRVSLNIDGVAPQPLPLAAAWYRPLQSQHSGTSVCVGSDAFAIGRDRVIVLFTADRRPGLDSLAAVLIDLANGIALDARNDLAELTETTALHPQQRSLRIHVVRGYEGSATQAETPQLAWSRLRAVDRRLQLD